MHTMIFILLGCFYMISLAPIDEKASLAHCAIHVGKSLDYWSWAQSLNQANTNPKTTTCRCTHSGRPVFETYPQLKATIPHVTLCDLPTPIEKLEQLGKALEIPSLYIKHDDLTGGTKNGVPFYGGNKVRKLEFLFAQAIERGCSTVITMGPAGSNHVTATACHAQRLGLKLLTVLSKRPNSVTIRKNTLLQYLFGAEPYYFETSELRKMATVTLWLDQYYKTGSFPYVIPLGGALPIGVVGFVNAAFELAEQINAGLMPKPDVIYLPCSTCSTTAGLLLGFQAAGIDAQLVAVSVEPPEEQLRESIKDLFHETNKNLHEADPSFELYPFPEEQLVLNQDFSGPEYGIVTQEGYEAIKLMKATQNINLEGTYTGKALAALIQDKNDKKLEGKVVLFWDTYCGLDFYEFTKDIDIQSLPVQLQTYFTEEIQENLMK